MYLLAGKKFFIFSEIYYRVKAMGKTITISKHFHNIRTTKKSTEQLSLQRVVTPFSIDSLTASKYIKRLPELFLWKRSKSCTTILSHKPTCVFLTKFTPSVDIPADLHVITNAFCSKKNYNLNGNTNENFLIFIYKHFVKNRFKQLNEHVFPKLQI
jgi:hypothetical protein